MKKILHLEELLLEYKSAYEEAYSIPTDADAIIILSADGLQTEEIETISRINYAVRIYRKIFSSNIPVIFNGVTEEKEICLRLMVNRGVNKDFAQFQDCGIRGVANTLTQFEAVRSDSRTANAKSIIFVTDTYHIPRVVRTAGKQLPLDVKFCVTSDQNDWVHNNTFLRIMGEIDRIYRYADKGDILLRPR